ncbi:MAG: hypothetical protein PSV13_14450 [Lacunisphaera sp.]|nr:hypothetical protein [Lacunisphaera sp.]
MNTWKERASDFSNMTGIQEGEKEMFSYQVDLDRRIRADQPLRAIRRLIDFSFLRQKVAHCFSKMSAFSFGCYVS